LALVNAGIVPEAPSNNVFIMQYPDLLSVTAARQCQVVYFRPGVVSSSPYEIDSYGVDWLYNHFYLPLNAEIASAAKQYGWNLIAAPSAFHEHGYCTADSWIVSFKESNEHQGNSNGTLHPNALGQAALTSALYTSLQSVLPSAPAAGSSGASGSSGSTTTSSEAASAAWNGTWSTNFGTMTLTQNGASVSGSYTYKGGTITGTVSGSVFSGTWTQTPGGNTPNSGQFEFTVAADGSSFTGQWRYGSSGPWYSGWNGTHSP
jgi:hypothetical protein